MIVRKFFLLKNDGFLIGIMLSIWMLFWLFFSLSFWYMGITQKSVLYHPKIKVFSNKFNRSVWPFVYRQYIFQQK